APAIALKPDLKLADIEGGGSLRGVSPDNPRQKVDIAWTGPAQLNGNTHRIEVDQNVVLHAEDPDGTVSGATAKHLTARLTTRPAATQKAATQVASTQPAATKPASDMAFLANQDISGATLSGDVKVK